MKVKFVAFIGILGIILFCPDSEAIPKGMPRELYAKYLPKIACYFKQQRCSPEDAYFKCKYIFLIFFGANTVLKYAKYNCFTIKVFIR